MAAVAHAAWRRGEKNQCSLHSAPTNARTQLPTDLFFSSSSLASTFFFSATRVVPPLFHFKCVGSQLTCGWRLEASEGSSTSITTQSKLLLLLRRPCGTSNPTSFRAADFHLLFSLFSLTRPSLFSLSAAPSQTFVNSLPACAFRRSIRTTFRNTAKRATVKLGAEQKRTAYHITIT